MSRVIRYKESLNKFIVNRSCFLNKDNFFDPRIEPLLYNATKTTDKYPSILLLTIMNNLNKKNQIMMQGYYVSSCVEFLRYLLKLQENKKIFIEKYNHDFYYKLINYIILCSGMSIQQNLDSIKTHVSAEETMKISFKMNEVFLDKISYSNILGDFEFVFTDEKPNDNVFKWYLKDNNKIKEKINKMKQVKKDSLEDYIQRKYINLNEFAVISGWIMGCGGARRNKSFHTLASSFTYLYKLCEDFENIEKDITEANEYSLNYVVNYGLYDAYEKFMDEKNNFIKTSMLLDIYTVTIKEILTHLESRVDNIIDETSPDLKSNFTIDFDVE